jgi:hypothetical protein
LREDNSLILYTFSKDEVAKTDEAAKTGEAAKIEEAVSSEENLLL